MQPDQPEHEASAETAALREPREPREPRGRRETAKSVDRTSVVVARPGAFLTLVILSCFGAGYAIYWLLRTMHI